MAAHTAIVGIGNPYLGDDGIGPHIAHRLFNGYKRPDWLDILECPVGGLRLMELISPYDRALIIDAVYAGDLPEGQIVEFGIEDIQCTKNQSCQHDTNLANAANFIRHLGGTVPSEVRLLGITAVNVEVYGTEISPAVLEASEIIIARLCDEFNLTPTTQQQTTFEEFLA